MNVVGVLVGRQQVGTRWVNGEISWVLLGAPMLFVLVMMLDPSLTVDMTVLNIGSSVAYLVLISMMMIL